MRITALVLFPLLHLLGTSALPAAETPSNAIADSLTATNGTATGIDLDSPLAKRLARSCDQNAPGQIRIAIRGNGLPLTPIESPFEPCFMDNPNRDLKYLTVDRAIADGARFNAHVRVPGGDSRMVSECMVKLWPEKKPNMQATDWFTIGDGADFLKPCGIHNGVSIRCGKNPGNLRGATSVC